MTLIDFPYEDRHTFGKLLNRYAVCGKWWGNAGTVIAVLKLPDDSAAVLELMKINELERCAEGGESFDTRRTIVPYTLPQSRYEKCGRCAYAKFLKERGLPWCIRMLANGVLPDDCDMCRTSCICESTDSPDSDWRT